MAPNVIPHIYVIKQFKYNFDTFEDFLNWAFDDYNQGAFSKKIFEKWKHPDLHQFEGNESMRESLNIMVKLYGEKKKQA